MKKTSIVFSLIIAASYLHLGSMEKNIEFNSNLIKDEDKKRDITIVSQKDYQETTIDLDLARQFKTLKSTITERETENDNEEIKISIDNHDVNLKNFFTFVREWFENPYKINLETIDFDSYINFSNYLGDLYNSQYKIYLSDWLINKKNTKPQITILDKTNNEKIKIDLETALQFGLFKSMLEEHVTKNDEEKIEIPIDNHGVNLKHFFIFIRAWLKDPEKTTFNNIQLIPYINLINYLDDLYNKQFQVSLLDWFVQKIAKNLKNNLDEIEFEPYWNLTIAPYLKLNKDVEKDYVIPYLQSLFYSQLSTLVEAKVQNLIGHKQTVSKIIQLNDLILISGSYDTTIKIWDLKNNTIIKTLRADSSIFSLVKISDTIFASGHEDNSIKIWDFFNYKKPIKILTGHDGRVISMVLLNNGTLASSSFDNTIKVWDIENGQLLKTSDFSINSDCNIVKFASSIIYCKSDNEICAWNPETNENKTLGTYKQTANHIILLHDNSILINYKNGETKIWNPNNNNLIDTNLDIRKDVLSITQLKNSDVVRSQHDGHTSVCNINTGKLQLLLEKTNYIDKNNLLKAYITDLLQLTNSNLAIASNDATTQLIDINIINKINNVEQMLLVVFLIDYYQKKKSLPNLKKEFPHLEQVYMTLDVKLMEIFNNLGPKNFLGNFYSTSLKIKNKEIKE